MADPTAALLCAALSRGVDWASPSLCGATESGQCVRRRGYDEVRLGCLVEVDGAGGVAAELEAGIAAIAAAGGGFSTG